MTAYTTVPLKFSTANAEAPFSLNYSDAGQITLDANYNIPLGSGAGSGNFMNGASQFVVQPYNLTLSNIKCTTYGTGTCASSLAAPGNNPGAASAAGPAFIQAGQPFSATVTATNYQSAATPNFGQEISPAAVTLTPTWWRPRAAMRPRSTMPRPSAASRRHCDRHHVQLAGGRHHHADAERRQLSRFRHRHRHHLGRCRAVHPKRFCRGAQHAGVRHRLQRGRLQLPRPAAHLHGRTRHYRDGALRRRRNRAQLHGRFPEAQQRLADRTDLHGHALKPALNGSGLPATTVDPAIADLGTGQATLTFSAGSGLTFSRGAASAPFNANIALSINVIDTDGISAPNPVTFGGGSGISFSTSAAQYYGRLALRDAVGSELLDLPMLLTTQYYLSATLGFTTNTSDSCTAAPPISFSNYQLNLTAGETCVRDTGSPGFSGVGCAAPAAAGLSYRASAAAGNFNLILAAPGAGDAGAVSVTATAPSWLQYNWGSTSNPLGMATFGVFPGPTSRVHQREVY